MQFNKSCTFDEKFLAHYLHILVKILLFTSEYKCIVRLILPDFVVTSPFMEGLNWRLYLVVVVELVLAPVDELLKGENLLRGFYLNSFYLHPNFFCERRITVASGGSLSASEYGRP